MRKPSLQRAQTERLATDASPNDVISDLIGYFELIKAYLRDWKLVERLQMLLALPGERPKL